ncbi:MAG: toll/interleukin-1 receptor domain-containing protein [Promethearchaeota archaeon]
MITNREIKAEYFSSSKSIAFYQQEKEAIPSTEVEEIKKLRVFLSYSTLDIEHFQISDIVKSLEVFPEIQKVSYWEADSDQNIVEFMENTLKNTNVFLLFWSPNSVKFDAVKDEWQATFQMRKKGLLKIIPVYEDEEIFPVLL